MQGQLAKETFLQIYEMLNRVDHVPYDCGLLCEKACCRSKDGDMGIYLLPNEHLVLQEETGWLEWEEHLAEDYDFPFTWRGKTYFLTCNGNCPREKRPIQCRTFPLAPHLTRKGNLLLIWETLKLPYACPLLKKKEPLAGDFVVALYRAWQILISDPLIKDLVHYDSRNRERAQSPIQVVWPATL